MRIVVDTAQCRRARVGNNARAPRHTEAATTLVRRKTLLLVEKSDCARIEAVIATDYLYLSGINFGLENRRR
jgi:hypothetical protein